MQSKEGLDALFLYATEGILVVNEGGEIVRINPSAEKLFGYENGELIGQRIEVLVPKRLARNHESHREKYTENPHSRSMGAGMELNGLKKDGQEFPVEISLSPFNNERGRFFIAFIVDITIRKLAEEKLKNYSTELENQVKNRTLILEEAIQELEKTKRDLHNALDKEKELNELKSRFVSMASHEFRTPLTTMMSSLSLIRKYAETGDIANQEKHMGKIKSMINNLTDILNDFLSVSKLEEGRVENHPEAFDLQAFITETISEMQPLTNGKLVITNEYSGNTMVNLDKRLLKNILFNILSNGIKYSPEGKTITVRSEVGEDSVKISARDEGIGISKEDQKHLFQRFFRGNNASHIPGTGLGLSIVAKYAELMDAVIELNSVEGKGTIFTITFNQ
jgi:PAS domain S-box-containing protein